MSTQVLTVNLFASMS